MNICDVPFTLDCDLEGYARSEEAYNFMFLKLLNALCSAVGASAYDDKCCLEGCARSEETYNFAFLKLLNGWCTALSTVTTRQSGGGTTGIQNLVMSSKAASIPPWHMSGTNGLAGGPTPQGELDGESLLLSGDGGANSIYLNQDVTVPATSTYHITASFKTGPDYDTYYVDLAMSPGCELKFGIGDYSGSGIIDSSGNILNFTDTPNVDDPTWTDIAFDCVLTLGTSNITIEPLDNQDSFPFSYNGGVLYVYGPSVVEVTQ